MINTLTKQKFFDLIFEAGMESYYNHFTFEKSKESSPFDRITIKYSGTEYYFSFTDNLVTLKNQEYNCKWSPDHTMSYGSSKVETIDLVLLEFKNWLSYLKANLKAGGMIL